MSAFDERLATLGVVIPTPPPPLAAYVPWTRIDELVLVSGQGTRIDGVFQYIGQLGGTISLEDGRAAARICGLNLLGQLRDACAGDLSRVMAVLRITGYVNSTSAFRDHPKVVDGCSELMAEVFGEIGRHARTAIGVASLPAGMAVEVEGMFRVAEG